jgi:hypothetical protein
MPLAACGGESETEPSMSETTSCQARPLPFAGHPDAPRLLDLYLDCTADAVELLAVIDDAEGDADLGNVPQVLRVHRAPSCDGGTLEIKDDVAVGAEVEAFGIVFDKKELPDVYAMICTAERWPVDVELRDTSENITSGRAWANVLGHAP